MEVGCATPLARNDQRPNFLIRVGHGHGGAEFWTTMEGEMGQKKFDD